MTIFRWYDSGEKNTTKITLRVGERIQDTYTVYLGEPMIEPSLTYSAVQVPTVRITKNDAVVFEGGYWEETKAFFTPEGEFSGLNLNMTTYVAGADPWENYTMPKGLLVQLTLEPELVDRGDWRLYGLAVFLTIVMMADVAFPYTLFRWRHRRWVKDPEPTDDYMSMQHLSWVICPILLLVGYIVAATTTMAVV